MQPGSFRGVSFLVSSESEVRGKKTVTHEYPNSDRRFIEELGKQPSTFTFEAIIHGENAILQRQQLVNALERQGLGELVHPIYGTLQVQALGFTVSSNQTRMGQFRFSLTFGASEEVIAPAPETPTEQTVSANAETSRAALDNAIEENYVDTTSPLSLTTAAEKLGDVYDGVADGVAATQELTEEGAADFNQFINTSKDAAFVTAQKGENIGVALGALYTSALATVSGPEQLTEAWETLLDFNIGVTGNFSDIGPVTTLPRLERETNKSTLDEHTRLTALINLYESAAYTEFGTDLELEASRNQLDEKYTRYVEQAIADAAQSDVPSLAADPSFRTAIANLRTASRLNFNRQEQSVWRVVTITPGNTSMALMAYRYYGSLDQIDQVIGLNPDVNVANFNESSIQAVSK
jgi:prophage DNA circulation protein